jgi:hypothetical protein
VGIPLDVFSLYQLRGEGADCLHHLLLRVGRPGFSNADEGDYARAVEAADEKVRVLLEEYGAGVLAAACAGPHTASLLGELQARPVGAESFEGRGGFYVDLWLAETRFGRPWVVLGAAPDEEAFWREVAEDEDLSSLGAGGPARRLRAYFLAEEDDAARRDS